MGMNFTNLTIAMLIVVAFSSMFGLLIGELTETYNVPINSNFTATYSKIDYMLEQTKQLNSEVQGQQTPSTTSILDTLYNQGLSSIIIGFTSISLLITMLSDISTTLTIPDYIIGIIIAMVIVSLGYLALSAYFKSFFKL